MPTQWVTYSPRAPSSVSDAYRPALRGETAPLLGDEVADTGGAVRRQAEAFDLERETGQFDTNDAGLHAVLLSGGFDAGGCQSDEAKLIEGLRRSVGDNAAVAHADQTVGDLEQFVEVRRGQADRHPGPRHGANQSDGSPPSP